AVPAAQRRAGVTLPPQALQVGAQRADAAVGVAQRALERPVVLDARLVGGRPDAVVAGQRVAEPHVLARHVAGDARAAGAGRIVVGVAAQRLGALVVRVAGRADAVALGGRQARQLLRAILGVGIVAGRARHPARAAAQQEVARLARSDRAAPLVARGRAAPVPALPGERVAREQHLVTARAGPID